MSTSFKKLSSRLHWCNVSVRAQQVFGVDINEKDQKLPVVVRKVIEYFDLKGLDSPKTFDFDSSDQSVEKYLKSRFDLGEGEEIDINAIPKPSFVMNLLKQYLIELPHPLISLEVQECFYAAWGVYEKTGNIDTLKKAMYLMPKVHFLVLRVVCKLLFTATELREKNNTTSEKLAYQFAPILLHSTQTSHLSASLAKDPTRAVRVINLLITQFPSIFPSDCQVLKEFHRLGPLLEDRINKTQGRENSSSYLRNRSPFPSKILDVHYILEQFPKIAFRSSSTDNFVRRTKPGKRVVVTHRYTNTFSCWSSTRELFKAERHSNFYAFKTDQNTYFSVGYDGAVYNKDLPSDSSDGQNGESFLSTNELFEIEMYGNFISLKSVATNGYVVIASSDASLITTPSYLNSREVFLLNIKVAIKSQRYKYLSSQDDKTISGNYRYKSLWEMCLIQPESPGLCSISCVPSYNPHSTPKHSYWSAGTDGSILASAQRVDCQNELFMLTCLEDFSFSITTCYKTIVKASNDPNAKLITVAHPVKIPDDCIFQIIPLNVSHQELTKKLPGKFCLRNAAISPPRTPTIFIGSRKRNNHKSENNISLSPPPSTPSARSQSESKILSPKTKNFSQLNLTDNIATRAEKSFNITPPMSNSSKNTNTSVGLSNSFNLTPKSPVLTRPRADVSPRLVRSANASCPIVTLEINLIDRSNDEEEIIISSQRNRSSSVLEVCEENGPLPDYVVKSFERTNVNFVSILNLSHSTVSDIKSHRERTLTLSGYSSDTKNRILAARVYLREYYTNLLSYLYKRQSRINKMESFLKEKSNSESEKEKIRSKHFHSETEILRMKRIKTSMAHFQILSLIGQGGYGKIYLCRKKDTKEILAVKRMKDVKSALTSQNKIMARIKTERDVLAKSPINSPWLVHLAYSFQDDRFLYLAMEYVPGGNLRTLLETVGTLEEHHAKFYLAEMMLCVDVLHQMGYIHRDLKPDNFLIDKTGHLKLSDFGLSKYGLKEKAYVIKQNIGSRIQTDDGELDGFNPKQRTLQRQFSFVGTPDYIAVEVITGDGYDFTVDWWSLGVIFYEMLTGIVPFHGNTVEEIFHRARNYHLEHPTDLGFPVEGDTDLEDGGEYVISKEAWLLVQNLLCDSSSRIGKNGLSDFKKLSIFDDIDWKNLRAAKPPFIPELESEEDTTYFETQSVDEDGTSSVRSEIESRRASDFKPGIESRAKSRPKPSPNRQGSRRKSAEEGGCIEDGPEQRVVLVNTPQGVRHKFIGFSFNRKLASFADLENPNREEMIDLTSE
eukprot:TRINITY_DN242_c1_g2_i1.p1 TRINITY_DN242_c1_g2~~TRINITY_DN242_c1_g2_i1.p1  ORF type:complete len:1288 (+),score=242.18 TRINITY_DN242_c1_g2_i1:64-3927(+)